MTEREQRLLVSRALDIGERMLLSGGEVSRVEGTISRILKSYGVERVEVFTILSFISLTAVFEEDRVLTENRRVSIVAYSNDFTRLKQLNALSRELCATRPDLDMMAEKLESIDLPPRKKQFRELYWLLGYILSGTGFAIFFGGTWRDALGAGILVLAGLFPKIGAIINIMPQPVLGGAAVFMFASIVISGINLITKEPLTGRNATIVAIALGLGFGVGSSSAAQAFMPQWLKYIFGGSGIVPAAMIAIILNIIIPKDKKPEAAPEDKPQEAE